MIQKLEPRTSGLELTKIGHVDREELRLFVDYIEQKI